MAQSVFGSITIIVASIAGAVLGLWLLQHYWTPSTRRAHNDVIGPSVSVIGTTYAVIVAFMLSGVWNDLQAARVNAEQEANSLVNVFRLAGQLPPESGPEVQKLTHDYASVMITEEWPAMAKERSSPAAHTINRKLWQRLTSVQPRNVTEQQVMDHSLSELTNMTEHRRLRLLESRKRLPPILWAVLIVGGIVTVGSTCLLGIEDFKLHVVQVFEISFLISLMLVAIAAIDRPFQGDVHVPPDAFRFALETIDHSAAE